MAVTAFWFGLGLQNIVNGTHQLNWATDTVKVSLHTSTFAVNQDTLDFQNDLTNEVSSTGYTAGGATLANKTVLAYNAGTNTVSLDADDVTWTGVTFTARYAVIWKDTAGAASTDPLLGYVDFGADQTVSSGNFTIAWASDGVLKLVAA